MHILDNLQSLSVVIDAKGLTEAIHNTGRVYEEIGSMHGAHMEDGRCSL